MKLRHCQTEGGKSKNCELSLDEAVYFVYIFTSDA